MMRFSRVALTNWRNFVQAEVSLQNRVFLVGPNASGKSNFLDVFRFLRDLVVPGGGVEQAVISRGGITKLRSLAARREPAVGVDVSVQDDASGVVWRYEITFDQEQRRPRVKTERVWRNDELLLDRPDDQDRDDPERLSQTHLEQTFANRPFRALAEFFASVSYFHLVPQVIRNPDRWQGDFNDPYGGDFLERIARTRKKTQEARLNRIVKALRVAVPQLEELRLEKDERGIPHLQGKYRHWRPQGAWQTEADFSDGTLRLIGLLWALLDEGGPLLLEEPELSLHPAVVQYVPQMIRRILRDSRRTRQVILSTHSKDLLSEGVAADEILLFIPQAEGTEVKAGGEIEQIRILLEAGEIPGEVVIPYTQPREVEQLSLW